MAITREVLEQYLSLKKEKTELENSIIVLDAKIKDIENEKTVRDKVRGGDGGWQSFVIEGIPPKEYDAELQAKKKTLAERKSTLEALEQKVSEQLNDVERFICGIKDSQIRLIVRFKYVHGLSWVQVASRLGGNNTENGVKTAFHRYFKKNQS